MAAGRLILVTAALVSGCGASRSPSPLAPADAGPFSADLADSSAGDGSDEGGQGAAPAPFVRDWTPALAGFVDGDILSIWGSSDDSYFVGTDMALVYEQISGQAARQTPIALGTVGAGWSSDPSTSYAAGVSAWSANGGGSAGLYKREADGWRAVAPQSIAAVWGSSPTDVYAGGPAGLMHSSGDGNWTSEMSAQVVALWGTGPSDVYASTGPGATILHSAGDGTWQSVYSQTDDSAWAGWSSGAGDAFAVVSPAGDVGSDAVVVHSIASGWVSEAVGQPGARLVALWGSGPNDVYAGGYHKGSAGLVGDLYHSMGDGHWARVDLPGDVYQVTAIWGTGPASVYVGLYDVEAGPVVLHGTP